MIKTSEIEAASELYSTENDCKNAINAAFRAGAMWVCNMTDMRKSDALDEAMRIIETVGTTGIEHKHKEAQQWLEKYYPNRA